MHTVFDIDMHHTLETERPRLVRLCALLLGDADAAEDAAQEVLIEAWRHIDQLREPSALQPWLSGIARNVCARWQRVRGRHQATFDKAADAMVIDQAAAFDFEVELERHELATLLDRALALLPEPTRAVLIHKYIADLPHTAIAKQLGLSENVVAVRLHRGKLALRKVLSNELRTELEPFGVLTTGDDWQETRLWCSSCGQRLLRGKFTGDEFILRCSVCCVEPDAFYSQTNGIDLFGGVKGFGPALNRFKAWMHDHFQTALARGSMPCRTCGRDITLHLWMPDYAPPSVRAHRGLHVYCTACGTGSYESLDGLALNLPEGRSFFRTQKRIRTRPQRELTFQGAPAIAIEFESVTSHEEFRVVLHRDAYKVLAISGGRDE